MPHTRYIRAVPTFHTSTTAAGAVGACLLPRFWWCHNCYRSCDGSAEIQNLVRDTGMSMPDRARCLQFTILLLLLTSDDRKKNVTLKNCRGFYLTSDLFVVENMEITLLIVSIYLISYLLPLFYLDRFFFFFNHHFYFRKRFYPQRSSGQAAVTDVVSSLPRYVPLFFFVVHRVQHFPLLVDFHRT